MDKRACAAIHAVNLRNMLASLSQASRVVQGEEPDDFLSLFTRFELVKEAEATESGLYHIGAVEHPTRLFVVVFEGRRARFDQVEPTVTSLRGENVFVLETKEEIFVWMGAVRKEGEKGKREGREGREGLR